MMLPQAHPGPTEPCPSAACIPTLKQKGSSSGTFVFQPTVTDLKQAVWKRRTNCTAPFSLPRAFFQEYTQFSPFSSQNLSINTAALNLNIPRKAILSFCQMKNASSNQVAEKVSSGEC